MKARVGQRAVAMVAFACGISCGSLEEGDGQSSLDDSVNIEVNSGGTESAGGSFAGGESAASSSGGRNDGSGANLNLGGTVIAVQTVDSPPNISDCGQLPLEFLDPPCSDEDLFVGGGCYADRVRTIPFPLEGLEIPVGQLNLQLVLLPSETSLGLGGTGGTALGVPLQVWLSSATGGTVDGYDFELNAADTELYAYIFFEEPRFVPTLLTYGEPYLDWRVVRVALTSDGAILSERRVIFPSQGVCIR